ncbi:MAG TPA: sigma 54-interacting transcriptional regulator [Pirellulales bacterium]|jgi:Nif-specific regulatory protein|nr:sigma 54-interacting transcriptional regulator [Pirellulales bacterium]
MLAYLVIREGSKWSDVFRLVPGQTVTIGRAPTNQIVVKDERCSRFHAEVFLSSSGWTLRDLDSRNGTSVREQLVRGDYLLQPGDVIRIGQSQLAYVLDLAQAFPESSSIAPVVRVAEHRIAETLAPLGDSEILEAVVPAHITHRRGETKFFQPQAPDNVAALPKVGRVATNLCRLAFELAKSPDLAAVARVALNGLFEAAQVDAGAVLLLPRATTGELNPQELEVVASRTDTELNYHRVSNFIAATVLRDGEAVLARNIMGDSTLGNRDSKGEFHATSILCAPIRQGNRAFGLIHLYCTNPGVAPDPDDLEFTLAVADTVAVALDNLGQRQELYDHLSVVRNENMQLRERLGVESEIIGSSPLMRQVAREIARAAPSRATVLIRGESGVGKELVARAVHFSSPRRGGTFVCLNCAALSESLLESELFGHEKGAFTGATERKLGKFETADTGTLMLDEIGEMSPTIQAKFLRVLEGHPFERVGGSQQIKVDVRVIAATNRDLEKDVAEGRFRRDLYFRLHVLEIIVPGLRKRTEDIPELAHYFLNRFNTETGRKIRGYTPAAVDQMLRYRWPGNVRELKNVVERAVVLARRDFIDVDDLTLSNLATAGDTADVAAATAHKFEPLSLDEVEKRHILATLKSTDWNKSQTSALLGIERSTLDRKIRRYELDKEFERRFR